MQWTIIRLVVSENDWRRHNSEMEPKRRGKPSPLCTWRRSKTLGLRKATLRSRIHVQEVGLNAGGKGPASSRRGGFSLDIPLYRTSPVSAFTRTFSIASELPTSHPVTADYFRTIPCAEAMS